MKNTWYILLLMSIIILLSTCKKTPEIPTGSKIEIGETTLDSVSYYTAKISTDIKSVGNADIIQYGHCWSKDKEPTIESNKTELGKLEEAGSYLSEVSSLDDNTTYYIRSYLTSKNGVVYGMEQFFKTLKTGVPSILTVAINNITLTGAECMGDVQSDSGLVVTQRGVCWSTSISFDLENCVGSTNNGSGNGIYIGAISGLTQGGNYYVKAYASNSKGTAYGETLSFTTAEFNLPIVSTQGPSHIAANSVIIIGSVSGDNVDTIVSRGICWNKSGNPFLEDCLGYTYNGGGFGEYLGCANGLINNTLYYAKAYATNVNGTVYGDEISFTTKLSAPCEGITSLVYEGKTYHTVQTIYQCWFKENLDVGIIVNSSQDQTDNGVIEKYCYDNNEENCILYGGLYCWDELMQYTTNEGAKGICPDGWHVPTDDEWKILEGTVDSEYGVGDYEWYGPSGPWIGFDAGKNLKSISGWHNNGNGIDNIGFTALPSGRFGFLRKFYDQLNIGIWASSTEYRPTTGGIYIWTHEMSNESDQILRTNNGKGYNGYSVRCLKD